MDFYSKATKLISLILIPFTLSVMIAGAGENQGSIQAEPCFEKNDPLEFCISNESIAIKPHILKRTSVLIKLFFNETFPIKKENKVNNLEIILRKCRDTLINKVFFNSLSINAP